MPLTTPQADRIASNTADIAVLLRLDTGTPVRFWTGLGDMPVGADAIEPTGATYLGVGALADMPVVSQLINGVAERVQFSFSGNDPDMAAKADGDAFLVRNKRVNLGLLPLDEDLQPVDSVLWFRSFTADVITIEFTSDNDGRQIVTVGLSVSSAFTGRTRSKISYFTDVDQKKRSPDDRFCERTPLYSQGVVKVWPKF